ncbi:hypothetical protein [Brevundimonas sp.]|uniref:hypothetical protein n=1 Tax=Brevundimonas sp. TaxID=1871086 RepID=UPI00198DCA6D|nr:hypothetical protein [Brevundimonas sp.]MBD3837607.1 hypothetical protein [Brevundimonas sp.]
MTDFDLNNPQDAWQLKYSDVLWRFGQDLQALHRTNPWPDQHLLPQAINSLMTELWDAGFSQTEIRDAFDAANADMPRYAAGQERRP